MGCIPSKQRLASPPPQAQSEHSSTAEKSRERTQKAPFVASVPDSSPDKLNSAPQDVIEHENLLQNLEERPGTDLLETPLRDPAQWDSDSGPPPTTKGERVNDAPHAQEVDRFHLDEVSDINAVEHPHDAVLSPQLPIVLHQGHDLPAKSVDENQGHLDRHPVMSSGPSGSQKPILSSGAIPREGPDFHTIEAKSVDTASKEEINSSVLREVIGQSPLSEDSSVRKASAPDYSPSGTAEQQDIVSVQLKDPLVTETPHIVGEVVAPVVQTEKVSDDDGNVEKLVPKDAELKSVKLPTLENKASKVTIEHGNVLVGVNSMDVKDSMKFISAASPVKEKLIPTRQKSEVKDDNLPIEDEGEKSPRHDQDEKEEENLEATPGNAIVAAANSGSADEAHTLRRAVQIGEDKNHEDEQSSSKITPYFKSMTVDGKNRGSSSVTQELEKAFLVALQNLGGEAETQPFVKDSQQPMDMPMEEMDYLDGTKKAPLSEGHARRNHSISFTSGSNAHSSPPPRHAQEKHSRDSSYAGNSSQSRRLESAGNDIFSGINQWQSSVYDLTAPSIPQANTNDHAERDHQKSFVFGSGAHSRPQANTRVLKRRYDQRSSVFSSSAHSSPVQQAGIRVPTTKDDQKPFVLGSRAHHDPEAEAKIASGRIEQKPLVLGTSSLPAQSKPPFRTDVQKPFLRKSSSEGDQKPFVFGSNAHSSPQEESQVSSERNDQKASAFGHSSHSNLQANSEAPFTKDDKKLGVLGFNAHFRPMADIKVPVAKDDENAFASYGAQKERQAATVWDYESTYYGQCDEFVWRNPPPGRLGSGVNAYGNRWTTLKGGGYHYANHGTDGGFYIRNSDGSSYHFSPRRVPRGRFTPS